MSVSECRKSGKALCNILAAQVVPKQVAANNHPHYFSPLPMTISKLILIELWKRKSQLITGLLAITLGIAVIVAIQSVSIVSEQNVARNLDNLGANILVLTQTASIDDYYTSDIDAPTLPMDYVERFLNSTITGVDNLSPKLTRRVKVGNQQID